MPFPIAAAIGLGASIYGASAAKKAAARQAEAIKAAAMMEDLRIRELTAPYLEKYKWASGQQQNLASRVLMPQLGRESEILRGQHELSLSQIEKQKRLGLGKSSLFWGRTGNLGKARGEELQIGQMATEAKNRQNLAYGAEQEQYKDVNLRRLMNALGGISGQGAQGLGYGVQGARDVSAGMTKAAGVQAQGTYDFAQGLGSLGGAFVRDYLREDEQKRLARLLGNIKNKPGTAGTTRRRGIDIWSEPETIRA